VASEIIYIISSPSQPGITSSSAISFLQLTINFKIYKLFIFHKNGGESIVKLKLKQEGICWTCRMCGKCCDSPTVSKKDIGNIGGFLKISFNEVVKKYLKEYDGVRGILKEVNGKCIFLKGNKCSIYKVRPIICRLRPFSPQLDNNEIVLTYDRWFLDNCPGLYIGNAPIDNEEVYLKYGIAVINNLGLEEPTPQHYFEKFKKRNSRITK